MKFFLLLPLFIFSAWAQPPAVVATPAAVPVIGHETFVVSDSLKLTRSDHIIGEHMLNMIKLTEKGYVRVHNLIEAFFDIIEHIKSFQNLSVIVCFELLVISIWYKFQRHFRMFYGLLQTFYLFS